MLRNFEVQDLKKLEEIHEKYYKDEFPFPNLAEFISFCVAVNDNDEIIALGGVRSIAELIFVTDKSQPATARNRGLHELLQFCSYITRKSGKDQAYVHVEGAEWVRTLKRVGFKQFKAVPLVLNVD